MENKYTIEEFKKMFDEASTEALGELNNKMEEANKGKEKQNSMFLAIFDIQNMMAFNELKKQLFKEEN